MLTIMTITTLIIKNNSCSDSDCDVRDGNNSYHGSDSKSVRALMEMMMIIVIK